MTQQKLSDHLLKTRALCSVLGSVCSRGDLSEVAVHAKNLRNHMLTGFGADGAPQDCTTASEGTDDAAMSFMAGGDKSIIAQVKATTTTELRHEPAPAKLSEPAKEALAFMSAK